MKDRRPSPRRPAKGLKTAAEELKKVLEMQPPADQAENERATPPVAFPAAMAPPVDEAVSRSALKAGSTDEPAPVSAPPPLPAAGLQAPIDVPRPSPAISLTTVPPPAATLPGPVARMRQPGTGSKLPVVEERAPAGTGLVRAEGVERSEGSTNPDPLTLLLQLQVGLFEQYCRAMSAVVGFWMEFLTGSVASASRQPGRS
ncbi:hypothetical protein [Enterovirga sp. CN4-39]|uniref:hypothetical protein n=1 Tax=Enterovirga sp. CN4-39 TaxID=3400910 RepID=UPI003C06356F